ncbi:DEHA2F24244p [Debaryomyces hansenii CBS767]|uniref:O-acyltransferase n=1 Tax=Debaryomyces hansenii (strain ATCC 36239 / CBS 767 / BCRC 21394 / JCM 1990 / NBRC 0083 / IGC 2968) TaxID=284592 RepID=B5RUM9_DEBHA|nr:DEHA2F24244p [Debaryomyces hansenii CBS767]CAR66407.1 DEHA2F24244p [Debaryomyces hansenii CBS767]|eukprot:XP_002770890.1 DEHA2F24244p [Debaryomyces hansenii CBS767]
MIRNFNADGKLSTIIDRNSERRKSLSLDDEYHDKEPLHSLEYQYESATKLHEADDPVSTSSESILQSFENGELNSEPLMTKLDQIHNAAHIRLRRRKIKDHDRIEINPSKVEKDKFRSGFGDVKFYSVSSTIFDSASFKNSEFYGIYLLFWIGTGFLMMNNIVQSYSETSEGFFETAIMRTLTKDIVKIGFTDLAMYLGTYFAFFLQYACSRGWVAWNSSGWIIQCVFNFIHCAFWLYFASDSCMSYPWIGKVFLVLHNLVLIMKMHSYAFYNGYLWKILEELEFSENYLQKLTDGLVKLPEKYDLERTKEILDGSVRFCKFELEYQSSATTMSSESPIESFDLEDDIHDLQQKNIVKFPQNINLFNFFEYSMFPTLVYTLNFPRTRRIRWLYVLEKTCGVFGIIFLMILVAQNWIYPILQRAIAISDLPTEEKRIRVVSIFLDMLPPFLLIYILNFFLIWDTILNAIAELSRFADRDFYGPWWSSADWAEYSRIWNRPVHKFLLRHVYHSSISSFNLSRYKAMLCTFVFSSLVHELVMYVIFKRFRCYITLLQMSQIPHIALSSTNFMKERRRFGNFNSLFGLVLAPGLVCTLYLVF